MRREWQPEDLIACWTLVEADWLLVANKSGPTRLGFALVLKFFELEGRFPRHAGDLPTAAVEYVAGQVKIDPEAFAHYDFSNRTAKYHRVQIRSELGFREATRADEERLTEWLALEVCPVELVEDRQREVLLRRCREGRVEPPGRAERILGAARRVADEQFCAQTVTRLPEQAVARLEELVADDNHEVLAPDDERIAVGGGPGLLAELKADPGRLGLETLLTEIAKLERVRALGLPPDLFADVLDKRLVAWRARAAAEYPAWMRAHPEPVRLTLLSALCSCRLSEITDSLVELVPRRSAPDQHACRETG